VNAAKPEGLAIEHQYRTTRIIGVKQQMDARSPWIVPVHDLVRRAGEMTELHRQWPAPADLGIQLMRVPEGEPIQIDLRLESVVEGIWVSGDVHAKTVGECARCLRDLSGPTDFELQELFYYPGKDAEEDSLFIADESIDLEPPLRDAIVLELPFAPLCKPDCLGLCVICGFDLNEVPDHAHEEQIDARWESLKELKFDQ